MRPLHALLCLAGATAITPRRGTKALSLRGGTFCEFEAKQTGEQCGIEEPEKEVVKAITGASKKVASALGVGTCWLSEAESEAAVDAALWALAALLFAPLGVAAFLAYKAFEKSRAPPKRVVSQPEKKGKKSKKRD